MPITREEFEHGRIDLALPVARLLDAQPTLAFTAQEVLGLLVEALARNAKLEEVEQAPESLVSTGRIQKKEIAGTAWYTAVRRTLV